MTAKQVAMSALIDAAVDAGRLNPFEAAAFACQCISLFEAVDEEEMTFMIVSDTGIRKVTLRRTWQKLTSNQIEQVKLDS